jgi:hypothetical protein
MEDLRYFKRFNLRLPAKIELITAEGKNNNKLKSLKTRDISSRGAFFPTKYPFSEGTDVKIDLNLMIKELIKRNRKHAQIKVNGTVIRQELDGMAIIFRNDYVINSVDKID